MLLRAPSRVQLRLSGKAQVRLDGQDLSPGIQLALRTLELRGSPTMVGAPHSNPEPAEVRARVHREALVFSLIKTEVGGVRELELEGADGPLRARHYLPPRSSAPEKPPLLVFFHGGGFVIGDLDMTTSRAAVLGRHAGVQVLSVDYRLAPEHPFPAGGGDALRRVPVGGRARVRARCRPPSASRSGGTARAGNLSTVTAQAAARDGGPAPALQLLTIPAST